ncbi:hypothetical protein BCR33DRAFT_491664 [Rhizoclosmatium globosum]|uniref:Cilia- and flagella-associated protein 300 n=1 Tax=Rhizoclosmatium globosum TaxID=329046 RepID=A0A1Y2BMM8_9FUNG|nr:hypothetical protein BCR33DRAFT_491664 [Rhizoclosmatium globosum]|eukprot:ORY36014.1 hypothetical protein BCR33DRAFT_491664 [Rhizoclosmatium globosum]
MAFNTTNNDTTSPEIEELPTLLQTESSKAAAASHLAHPHVTRKPLIIDLSKEAEDEKQSTAAAAEQVHTAFEFLNVNEPRFKFSWMEKARLTGWEDKDVQAHLFKWGMQEHCYLKRFTFDRNLGPYEVDGFLLDFFNDAEVQKQLKVQCTMDRWGNLGRVSKVEKEETMHTVTSLTFFDRLTTKADIIRVDGSIRKCMDEYTDGGFLVADELRKCLLMPEAETYPVFSEADRREFVFHVFKAVCLGGRLCQYEDEIGPYLDATKKIYKDLISVTKDRETGKLAVSSHVFQIKSLESSVSPLFPIQHPQNFCYISVDPVKRYVNVFYHASDVYYN